MHFLKNSNAFKAIKSKHNLKNILFMWYNSYWLLRKKILDLRLHYDIAQLI